MFMLSRVVHKPEAETNEDLDAMQSNDQQKVQFVPKIKEAKRKYKGPSLIKILFSIYWKRFLLIACLKLVHDICIFIHPMMLE